MTKHTNKPILTCAKNIGVSLLLTVFFMPSIFAQEAISITEYLESTFKNTNVKSNSKQLSFLKDFNYNLPVINSIDLRTEATDDFQIDRQKHSVRLTPNSFKAMSLQKKLHKNKVEKVKIDNELSFNEELKKRYLLLLDYYFTDQITQLGNKRKQLEKDKLKILSKSIYGNNFDIKDLIESEDELLTIELKLANLKDVGDAQEVELQQLFNSPGKELTINFNDLIGVDQLMNSTQNAFNKDAIEIQSQKLKLATLNNEMALKKATSNQILDFFQAKFEGNEDILNENLTVGIGFNIPFFGNNRKQKGDYYFDKLSEESKLRDLEEKVNKNLLFAENEFKNAVMNYQVMSAQHKSSSVTSILESYKRMEGANPVNLLNLISLQSKKELELLQSKHKLYSKYIEVLASKEILFEKPLRNFLSPFKEYIKE